MPDPFDKRACWTDAEAAAIRAELGRVLEGNCLRQSPRQQRLLRHVVEASLDGAGERLKGYTLGVEVFDRGVDFDPNADPIVRVEAGRLRSKLLEHYAVEGADAPVRIDVPKGGYAARFEFRKAGAGFEVNGSHRPAERLVTGTVSTGLAGDLPTSAEPLFGRDEDMVALDALLSEHRVVTVLGAGGIGKTRLAQATAHRFIAKHGLLGAWVDLAQITDPVLLTPTLSQALELPIVQQGDAMRGLLAALRPLTALIVLDNAEHLVEAVAHLVRAAVDTAPGLRVLVTSQAPLQISGERLFRLEGLAVPAADVSASLAIRAGAVALFVDRARATDQRFELTEENVAAVVGLCSRLAGLPLAIRLAAARAPLLGVSGMEARLCEPLQLIVGSSRDAPSRQQTLLAALQWSVGLLSPSDQALFRQIGVFPGAFSIDLAVDVCANEATDEWTVIDGLGRLVDRSLLSMQASDPPRYRLHEGPRHYALRLIAERNDELHHVRSRHARATAGMLAVAKHMFWTMSDNDWLRRWAPELDNVRAALDWSARHDTALFVTLVGSSLPLFNLLDLNGELQRRASVVDIACIEGMQADALATYWAARLLVQSCIDPLGPTSEHALQAEHYARAAGDPHWLFISLCLRAAMGQVPATDSAPLLAEIAELESDEWPLRTRALRNWPEFLIHNRDGRTEQALAAAERGLAMSIAGGAIRNTMMFGTYVMGTLLELNDPDAALERSIEIRAHLKFATTSTTIQFEGTCAACLLARGDLVDTRRQLEQIFHMSRTVEWAYFGYFANVCLWFALAERRLDAAARLLGYANLSAKHLGAAMQSVRWRNEAHALFASRIEATLLAELIAEGERLDPEGVCALVLAEPPLGASTINRPADR